VATAAGVSRATVSNVLNHPEIVNASTRDRVLETVQRLGYVPNRGAQTLASGRSREIALVTGSLRHSFSVDIALGAQDEALNRGLYLHLSTHDDNPDLCAVHLRHVAESRVGGTAVVVTEGPRAMMALVEKVHGPFVLINHRPTADTVSWTAEDNDWVGELAVRHMIDRGRRRLLYVSLASDRQSVAERLRAVRRCAAEQQIELETIDVGWDDPEAGPRAAAYVRDGVDGVIAVTDMLGMQIIQHFVERGIAIPNDVAVMGCDYNAYAWGGRVPMTTITNQGYQLGVAAIRMLADQMAAVPGDEIVHQGVVLRPHLVERLSTETSGHSNVATWPSAR
jgi:LacI family transcriptional regulator